MKKIIFGLLIFFTVVFLIGWLVSENSKMKREIRILSDSNVALAVRNAELHARIDSLNTPYSSEVIYHAKDFKTKDFFTFLKISRAGEQVGYEIITDLKIDRDEFDLIYEVLIDSMADLHFAMENLWGESRVGANQHHQRNSDGSIDFGYFGENYPKGTNPQKVGVTQQARDYCKHVNEANLMSYPPEQRRSRYYERYWWLKDKNKR